VDVVFRDRKSMRPSEIAQAVPALRALVSARRIVQDVAARKLGADAAQAQLARALPRPAWADAIAGLLRAAAPEPAPRHDPPRAAAPKKSDNGNHKDGLDALLDMVQLDASPDALSPPSEPLAQPARGAPAVAASPFGEGAPKDKPGEGPFAPSPAEASRIVAAVARSARPGAAFGAPAAGAGAAVERLERAFRDVLGAVVRHPEVRRLESSWRGLRLLTEHCERRAGVEVDVLCAGRDEVASALLRLAEPDEARPAVDLVVVDQMLGPTAADLDRLHAWAGHAEGLLAPVVVGGTAGMLGADELAQAARSTSALSASDDPRAVAVRSLAAREAARWLALVLNQALVRAPYTAGAARQQDPPFEEDSLDPEHHVFANGAYVVAALCARSHARVRWPTAITGARDGTLGNLPVHPADERGRQAPLEVIPSDDAVKDAARAGLTLLACAPNTDAAVLSRAPMLHRPAGAGGGAGAADATLADQLFVGRLGRAVGQVAAAIPRDTDPRAAGEVARIALAELFVDAAPPGPEIFAKVDPARGALTVTVRPHRFAGVAIEEVTLGAALG
jgi:hypothetical protein